MTELERTVYTIGHSTLSQDAFIDALERHAITAVADVRSSPYSRFNPQFNREGLADALKSRHIRYVFLGRELGARSEDPSCYERGRVVYARLARTALFQEGLSRVIQGSAEHRITLMCAEKEPLECHRTILVARALTDRGVDVRHILADGRVESHQDTMSRLLALSGLPEKDLFRSREGLVAQALAMQEHKIAYIDQALTQTSTGDPA